MKQEFEVRILPGGVVQTIYQDGIEAFASELGAEVSSISRASNVEWDKLLEGWTVKAAHDPRIAICYAVEGRCTTYSRFQVADTCNRTIAVFDTRDEALKQEVEFFWQLLPKGITND